MDRKRDTEADAAASTAATDESPPGTSCDALIDEAGKESFPASDPPDSYRID